MKNLLFKAPMSQAQFIALFGSLYESSPWVAEAVWPGVEAGMLAAPDDLITAMRDAVDAAPAQLRLALLKAHPELVGKAAIAGDMTAASQQEQSSAGLDQCTPEQFARFQNLNRAYLEKFGFPFIVAVTGMTRADILNTFQTRLNATGEDEFSAAINQVHRIALIRFAQIDSALFAQS